MRKGPRRMGRDHDGGPPHHIGERPDLGSSPNIRRQIKALRVEWQLLIGTAMFFAITVSIYFFWSGEVSGSVMLFFTVLLGILPGSYLAFWSRRMQPRPEDRPDGTYADGTGAVGAFPDSSIWPFILGAGAAFSAVSLVFGYWTLVLGLTMVVSAVVGVILESRRGGTV
ncbi:MAG: cytochrome c oxidase subunit 4 [Actinomycetota bacterium]|nr:cytochrome c oxidase subunit 4 [Actinomycetota bacterium]